MQVVGTRNTSGDGTAIIAAPGANKRIVIYGWRAQAEVDGDQTVLLKSGSTTIGRVFMSTKAQGILERMSSDDSRVDEKIYCGTNEAVYVNLSASLLCNYTVRYYIQDLA